MEIDGTFRFYVDIFGAGGGGSGPLESVTRWSYTARLDRAGSIAFEYYASDPRAELVTMRCTAQAFAWIDGEWFEIGYGIVERMETVMQADGRVLVRASGLDLLGEFGYRSVRALEIGAGNGATLNEAINNLKAFDPGTGWGYTIDNNPVNDYFYARFDGESTLAVYAYLVDKLQMHFYRAAGRSLHFANVFTDSGLHAVQASGDMDESACVITGITRTVNAQEYLSRLYVTGTGVERESSLTLAATTRTPPAGYTLNKAESWISNDTAASTYGYKDYPEISFKSITPISNTDADYVSASDFLFDSALAELQRRSSMEAQKTYDVDLANCTRFIRPMQTIRLTHSDAQQDIDIDESLNILEVTWEVDRAGPRTAGMVVSTHEYWPQSSTDSAAERVRQEKIFRTHPQSSLNEWWGNFREVVGDNQIEHMASFYFVMGKSVMMVQQVVFRFRVEQEVVTTKSYTLGSATQLNEASVTGWTAVDIQDETVVVAHDPDHPTLVAPVSNDDAVPTLYTNTITTDPPSSPPLTEHNYGAVDTFTQGALSTNPATHFHNISSPGAPIPGHQHEYQHQHTVVDHYHETLAEADHLVEPHGHTNDSHQHSETVHAHLLPGLAETFGRVRVQAIYTYAMSDLEYSVNGGGWESLDIATGTGDGFFELDITPDVTNPALPFRPAQESGNNIVEIRRKTAAAVGKSAMIRASVGVRTVIQAVAVS